MNRVLHIGKMTFRGIWLSINVFVGITTAISAYCGYIDPDKMADRKSVV